MVSYRWQFTWSVPHHTPSVPRATATGFYVTHRSTLASVPGEEFSEKDRPKGRWNAEIPSMLREGLDSDGHRMW